MKMKIQVVLLISMVTRGSAQYQTPQPKFDPEKKHSYTDPEPKLTDYVRLEDPFKKYPGVETGFMIAGRSEFPYLVALVRDPVSMQENRPYKWDSTGMLISRKHVLTTCRVVTEYNCLDIVDNRTCTDWSDCECWVEGDKREERIKEINASEITVYYYATNPSFQEWVLTRNGDYLPSDTATTYFNGLTTLWKVHIHPNCEWDMKLRYDLAIGFLKFDLIDLSHFVNYDIRLPIVNGYVYNDRRLQYINDRHIICYVASIQHDMSHWPRNLNHVIQYKVKYRVYPYDWERCVEDRQHLCTLLFCKYLGTYVSPKSIEKTKPREKDAGLECWQTRSKYSSVCDHDRGSPLVCNGKLQGIVLRGARRQFCNPGVRHPFIIQRIYVDYPKFHYYVADLNEEDPLPSPHFLRPDSRAAARDLRGRPFLVISAIVCKFLYYRLYSWGLEIYIDIFMKS